ncbi:TPA: PTS transporter subunit EIIC [Escherichia coli]|nr:PTS transporter subunit EIIC [Escherichia coli]
MGLMASFERGMERFLVPVAIKLNSQKHVAAVRDGFVFTFPIIMASSLIILINFAILSPDGFIAGLLHLNSIFPNLEKAQAIFTPVMNGSVNIMSIMIAFLVARNVAISYEQDDLLCGLTAIGAFFIVYTPYQMIDGQAFLTTKYLGAQGLFVAVIVALITSEIFCRLARNPKITITMPAAVPPAVARSFKVLLPIFFVMVFFSALNYCLTLISPAGLNDLIYTLIQTPLKHMGTNIFAVIILGAVGNFLWVLGIHGPNTTSAIRETVFSEANLENLSWAAQHGTTWGAPYPITWTSINDAFANCGGSGKEIVMFADEELVMELLINAGQARSDAMEAIRCAGQKDWQGATKLMASSESACLQAHKIQTALISQDEGCGKIEVNLILIHAQDHLMNAILCQDLAREIISLRKDLHA